MNRNGKERDRTDKTEIFSVKSEQQEDKINIDLEEQQEDKLNIKLKEQQEKNHQNQAENIFYYKKQSELYPKKLNILPDAPGGIYVEGCLPDENQPAVAIVGARMCSGYGKKQAYEFGRKLAEHGVAIISGLARGVDGYAHEGALDGGGRTFAVLGCGLDYCYPPEHKNLWHRIVSQGGGILTEFPMCTPPKPYLFPKRNRIISALSDLVLVVEAKERSGSLITADCALEQGKTVYAVPGRVCDSLSFGCNRLIAQGAGIAISVEYILSELHIDFVKEGDKKEKNKLGLASDMNLVYSCLGFEPLNLEGIVRKTGLSLARISEILLMLELDGYIRQTGKNNFVKS